MDIFWSYACRSFWVGGLLFPFYLFMFYFWAYLYFRVFLCILLAIALCSEQRLYIKVWTHACVLICHWSHFLHQMFPLPTSWRVFPTSPSCPHPLICGEFCKAIGLCFFHIVFQMCIIVLLVICNPIIF